MLRICVNFGCGRVFHDAAVMHDQDAVAHVLYHSEVVRNKEVGQAELLLEILEKVHDLGLDADIERADGFVAYDEIGFHR